MVGAIKRHGPHHEAHISSSTGVGDRSTTSAKFESVIVVGAVDTTGSGDLHRPHTGVVAEEANLQTLALSCGD